MLSKDNDLKVPSAALAVCVSCGTLQEMALPAQNRAGAIKCLTKAPLTL